MKTLHKPIKVQQFLSRGKIQKCLTQFRNILAFSAISQPQTESYIYQGIFLHVIPVRYKVPWYLHCCLQQNRSTRVQLLNLYSVKEL